MNQYFARKFSTQHKATICADFLMKKSDGRRLASHIFIKHYSLLGVDMQSQLDERMSTPAAVLGSRRL